MSGPTPGQQRLEPLAREWRFEAIADGQVVLTGITTFEWLEDGAYLLQQASPDGASWTHPVQEGQMTSAVFGSGSSL